MSHERIEAYVDQQTTGAASLPSILMDRLDEIAAICRDFGVQRLWIFGSAVHGTFDPETSDLDFMVDLGEYEPTVARRYVRFYDALRNLFGRQIDLITTRTNAKGHFLEDVIATREMIYAA
ncbi:MAG: hypothetical protein AVDCRST_MAG33-207 [uncultured Thermomicrobiales bacterium]|uniref:Polymerase nucleotidyl transferase domain-containing protein n=1 Tax=uncultured Thermomicrobiales bacterium TaxID=1645740 RepID=A0A6J4UAK3_9BACT|nr:MAG: hypothetical protein AVDCRST_MAG33-207 [uncultured Thermomicrobiales bacterium]